MERQGFRIKAYLVEVRYRPLFKLNSAVWEMLDFLTPERFAPLPSGGVEGIFDSLSNHFSVEPNRSHFLVENLETPAQFDEWTAKAARFMNQILNRWQIKEIERIGVRFHLFMTDPGEHGQDFYANLLTSATGAIKSTGIADKFQSAGFVLRFEHGKWGVRFGGFSADAEVMKKYHKFNSKDSVFSKPGIVYDVDAYQTNIPAITSGDKADITPLIREAYANAVRLATDHLESLRASAQK